MHAAILWHYDIICPQHTFCFLCHGTIPLYPHCLVSLYAYILIHCYQKTLTTPGSGAVCGARGCMALWRGGGGEGDVLNVIEKDLLTGGENY